MHLKNQVCELYSRLLLHWPWRIFLGSIAFSRSSEEASSTDLCQRQEQTSLLKYSWYNLKRRWGQWNSNFKAGSEQDIYWGRCNALTLVRVFCIYPGRTRGPTTPVIYIACLSAFARFMIYTNSITLEIRNNNRCPSPSAWVPPQGCRSSFLPSFLP
jgi:hypothetical protein